MGTMSPFQQVQQTSMRPKYIKKGRIHSENAMKTRAEDWIKKWENICKYSQNAMREISTSDENFEKFLNDSTGTYKLPPRPVKGYSFQAVEESLEVYEMLKEQMFNIEVELDLTTDDDEDDEIDVSTFTPYQLHIKLTENDMRRSGYVNPDSEDEAKSATNQQNDPLIHSEDEREVDDVDSETEPVRPISRISLMIPYNDNDGSVSDFDECVENRSLSRSGYLSYYETDFEDNDEDAKMYSLQPNFKKAKYGHVIGVPVGTMWKNRRQFSRRCVHRPHNALIHGGPSGAYSMVLSAAHSVVDRGETFDFFGEGGRDPRTKKHVADQKMNRGNLSLRENIQTGTPVRVIRGHQLCNEYAPDYGYRYDGLYSVIQYRIDKRINGFKVFVFTFVRCANQPPLPSQNNTTLIPLSDSDSEVDIVTEKARKKRKKKPFRDISRSSTPLSVVSDDQTPPALILPEKPTELPILYPTPPCLTPSLHINTGLINMNKRPVVSVRKLHKDITTKAMLGPVKVSEMEYILSGPPKKIMKVETLQPKGKTENEDPQVTELVKKQSKITVRKKYKKEQPKVTVRKIIKTKQTKAKQVMKIISKKKKGAIHNQNVAQRRNTTKSLPPKNKTDVHRWKGKPKTKVKIIKSTNKRNVSVKSSNESKIKKRSNSGVKANIKNSNPSKVKNSESTTKPTLKKNQDDQKVKRGRPRKIKENHVKKGTPVSKRTSILKEASTHNSKGPDLQKQRRRKTNEKIEP